MDCFELKDPKQLKIYCQVEDEVSLNRVFICFNKLFFQDFCKIFRDQCVLNSTLYTADEQLRDAFNFGVYKFYDTIKTKGWEERGAIVKTAILTFCMFQLLALTKTLRKYKDRASKFDNQELMNLITEYISGDEWETERLKLSEAFEKLDPVCKDFIRWRKLKEMTDYEIKTRYPEVFSNSRKTTVKTNRCMDKLRKLCG